MSDLTIQTRANYRVQCRRLFEIWELMDPLDERRPALEAQLHRLCDKLGYEFDRLSVTLYTSNRGRPRLNPDVSDIDALRKIKKGEPGYYSPQAVEARRAEQRRAEQASADDLNKMINLQADTEASEHDRLVQLANEQLVNKEANSGDKGHESATDDASAVGGADRSTV